MNTIWQNTFAFYHINGPLDIVTYVMGSVGAFMTVLAIFSRIKGVAVRVLIGVLGVVLIGGALGINYAQTPELQIYDRNGKAYINMADVVYFDENGGEYRYRFKDKGYDVLFDSEGTGYDADLCYLDANGYFVYDEAMSITVSADKTHCVDSRGEVYYPLRMARFDKNGSIQWSQKDFYYDRAGNTYANDCVPFYDMAGNRYRFSINSGEVKGRFVNLDTGEAIESDNAFVDADGYLFSSEKTAVTENADGAFVTADGGVCYRAVSVQWDANGQLTEI